jgi:N utilization substance protein B
VTPPSLRHSKAEQAQLIESRRLARQYALQGLYEWLLNGGEPAPLAARVRDFAVQHIAERLAGGQDPQVVQRLAGLEGEDLEARVHALAVAEFEKCDRVYLDELLQGCIEGVAELDRVLARFVDRPTRQLSPIEHAALLIGAFELQSRVDVPYRVAINEAVELAKAFGGTDGHKYVNGVLDKVATELRGDEVRQARQRRR